MTRTQKTLKVVSTQERQEVASIPVSFRLTAAELEVLDARVKKVKGASRSSIAKEALMDALASKDTTAPAREDLDSLERDLTLRIEHAVRETAKTSLAVTHKSVRQLEEQIAVLTRVVQELATRI